MATVTAPWWLWWVLGGLDAAGAVAVCWVAAGWAKRAADWLRRDRVTPLLEDDFEDYCSDQPAESCSDAGCPVHGWSDKLPLPLPPERTWEQMTSHQLPGLSPRERSDFSRREKGRWLQAAVAEVQQRQAYAALDLEYPSGLLARVREAAQ